MKTAWITAIAMVLGLAAPAAMAADNGPSGDFDLKTMLLAQNDATASAPQGGAAMKRPSMDEAPLLTANNLHLVLGLGSLIAAGAAGMSAPEDMPAGTPINKGFHHYAGITAAALGGAAIASGFAFHWNDFDLEDGLLDRDNLHVLLGILGTAGYIYAVSQAPGNGHAGAGMAGAGLMLTGIALTW